MVTYSQICVRPEGVGQGVCRGVAAGGTRCVGGSGRVSALLPASGVSLWERPAEGEQEPPPGCLLQEQAGEDREAAGRIYWGLPMGRRASERGGDPEAR